MRILCWMWEIINNLSWNRAYEFFLYWCVYIIILLCIYWIFLQYIVILIVSIIVLYSGASIIAWSTYNLFPIKKYWIMRAVNSLLFQTRQSALRCDYEILLLACPWNMISDPPTSNLLTEIVISAVINFRD